MINALDPRDYQQEQEEERLREAERIENGFRKIYTDKDHLNNLFNSAQGQFALQYSNEPEEVKARSANWELLSYREGRQIYMGEYENVRDKFAFEKFGARNVNDQQLYDLIAKDFTRDTDIREATTDLYNKAIRRGLEDTLEGKTRSWTEQWETWRQANKDLIKGEEEWPILKNAFEAMQKAQGALGARGSIAAETWATLNAYAEGKAGEEQLFELGRNLGKMPLEDRRQVYQMIHSAAATEEDPKDFSSFVDNLWKATTRGFGFAEGLQVRFDPTLGILPAATTPPIEVVEMQATGELRRAERMPDGPSKDEAIAAANEKLGMAQVVRELRQVADAGIDPIEPIYPKAGFFSKGTVERGIYGIAGSVGWMTAAAANPGLAAAAIWRDEYNKFRLEFPEVSPGIAGAVSMATAGPQAIIERFQVRTLAGKIPFFDAFAKNLRSNITRRILGGGIAVATQNIQEATQDAISDFMPGLLGQLTTTMPDIDWNKKWEDYKDARAEVIWASTFFGMASSITMDPRDLKNPQDILNDRLLSWMGFSAWQRDRVQRSSDPQATIREITPTLTKSQIAHGIKVAEADLAAAEKAQNDPTMPTMNITTQPDGTYLYTVTRPAPMETASVTIVDPRTGLEESVEMEAGLAKKTAKSQADSLQTVIDCLIK